MKSKLFKPRVRKKFIWTLYGDPYLELYVNMECPSYQRIIHYGYERCPKCGAEIDQNHPEVKEARRRSILDMVVFGILCLLSLALGIFVIVTW